MKKLFTDNRTAGIHACSDTKSGPDSGGMAEQLGVSERTIRNDIRQLNEDLAGSASIEGVQGRYSLRIFDPAAYKKTFEKICNTDGLFDPPRGRRTKCWELMQADEPLKRMSLPTDDRTHYLGQRSQKAPRGGLDTGTSR